MSRLRRLMIEARSLRPQGLWMLLRIGGLLVLFVLLRRVCSLPTLLRWFDARPAARPAAVHQVDQVVPFTDALLRRVYGPDYCIPRSLVLFRFLRRWGYPARFHIGMAREDGELGGHAWLALHGQPFAERKDPRDLFRTLYVYPLRNPSHDALEVNHG